MLKSIGQLNIFFTSDTVNMLIKVTTPLSLEIQPFFFRDPQKIWSFTVKSKINLTGKAKSI